MNPQKNIVIITSLLECPQVRTFYTRKERFEQTKLTIASVRKRIPSCYIVLIDCTVLNPEEKVFFDNSLDLFIDASECAEVKDAVYSNCKSNGERMYILATLKILGIGTGFSFFPNLENIFKLSGRYYLNQEFKYEKYDNDKCVLRTVPDFEKAVYTNLFKLNKSFVPTFVKYLSTEYNFFNPSFGMEQFMYGLVYGGFIKEYIDLAPLGTPLGVSGLLATSQNFLQTC